MSCTVWLTGLSGSGKSTLAQALQLELKAQGRACAVLDGDVLRAGLCRDLGFSAADRSENIRRVAEVARLFNCAGSIAIVALISPLQSYRAQARCIIGEENMVEVHVAAPLTVCEARDPKGLYQRARLGDIPEFTGVSAPYEAPQKPDLVLDTSILSIRECLDRLLRSLAS